MGRGQVTSVKGSRFFQGLEFGNRTSLQADFHTFDLLNTRGGAGPLMPKYIVFGGPLASGKTTLASRFAAHLGATTILEKVENHPLMGDFYKDPSTYALQTEMIFAIMHYHDIRKALNHGLFKQDVVSDLFFDGAEAYASRTLVHDDLNVYVSLFRLLQERIPTPTRVFYLEASTEFLMDRVRSRGRDYEKPMTFEYLDGVNKSFKEFIKGYRRAPVTVLDMERMYGLSPAASNSEIETCVSG